MRVLPVLLALCGAACSGRYPDATASARLLDAAPGLPEIPRRCLVANHVHTIVSDRYSHAPTDANIAFAYSKKGLGEAIAAFTADGVDAIVLADHNSIAAAFDPQRDAAPITVVAGMEWTTRSGHALLIGPTATSAGDAILPPLWRTRPLVSDFRKMVDRTHERGGVVVIAHPRVPFRAWPDDTFGADGVEVWGLDLALMRNRAAQRWWHDRLVRGEQLAAVAGTDLHPGATIRSHRHPLNWVYAPRCDQPSIVAAMRDGHLLIVRDGDSPLVTLGVEAGGALDHAEAREGDSFELAGPTVDLQVRVLGGAGTRLRVLGRTGVLHSRDITAYDESVRLQIHEEPGGFVRAELHAGRQLLALTNPIYLR